MSAPGLYCFGESTANTANGLGRAGPFFVSVDDGPDGATTKNLVLTMSRLVSTPPSPSCTRQSSDRWDQLGLVLSGVCAVHCLALPLLLLALPLWHQAHLVHDLVHPAMAALILPVIWKSLRLRPCSDGFLRIGVCLIWLALPIHAFVGEFPGLLVTLAGSVMLINGHRGNMRCRQSASV